MAWSNLIAAVNAVITSNGNNEITGQVLRELLTNNVIPILGASKYKGIATPSTSPGTPQYDVFYLASQAGTYANFGGAVIPKAGIYALRYVTNAWVLDTILAIEDSDIVGDRYATVSNDSRAIKSSGAISFTVKPFLSYVAEQDIIIQADPSVYMRARITSYDSATGALVADVKDSLGSGTYSSWIINLGSTVPAWGNIKGTLANQTDLQNALNAKANQVDLNDLSDAVTTLDGALTTLSGVVTDQGTAIAALELFRNAFDLTGAADGNALVYNGSQWVAGTITPTVDGVALLNDIDNAKTSFWFAALGANSIADWDSFTRVNGALGSTEGTGEAWSQYSLSATPNPIQVAGNSARFAGVENSNIPSFAYLNSRLNTDNKQVIVNRINASSDFEGAAFFKDSNNWIFIAVNQQSIIVKKKIAGLETTIFNQGTSFSNRYRGAALEINATLFVNGAGSSIILNFLIPQFGINQTINLSTDYAALSTNAPAFYIENKFGGRINSFLYKNLSA